jgi:NAD(P)-dependent dehydrogenase (short-subunit alcohol dehydrogenase family)
VRLEGKTALVTGGANGIGAAICRHYRREGAHLAIVDREQTDLSKFTEVDGPGRVEGFQCDVTDSRQVEQTCASALEALGGIDILVNNAGGSGSVAAPTLSETTDEIWDHVLALNLTSILRFARALVPGMKTRGWGRIINMSSRSRFGVPTDFPTMKNTLGYVVSKGAIVSLTRQLSRELGPYGITCNAIAPGLVLPDPSARITRIFRSQPEEWQNAHIAKMPVGRAGTGDDIASLALYLASPGADFLTGETIDINGGSK